MFESMEEAVKNESKHIRREIEELFRKLDSNEYTKKETEMIEQRISKLFEKLDDIETYYHKRYE